MYTSKILGKTYKTKAAYKTQITKYQKHAEYQLKIINDLKKKGSKTWFGDPIDKFIRGWEVELLLIEREKKLILLYDGKVPVIEINTKKRTTKRK